MARTPKGAVSPNGQEPQEEMTVVVLRLKGGGDTLKKAFDALASAFNSLGPTPQITKYVSTPPKQINGAVEPVKEEDNVEEETDESEITVASPDASSTPVRSAVQRKPKFLTDFDLTAGDVSWKDFANAQRAKERK